MNVDPDSIRLVGEADLLELAGVGRGAWNGWIKSGYVGQASDGLYSEQEVVAIAVLKLLGDCLPMSKAVIAWQDCQAGLSDCCSGRRPEDDAALDLVVDLQTLASGVIEGPKDLFERLHAPVPSPRGMIVIPLAAIMQELRTSFWRRARPASDFSGDKRRKSARRNPSHATKPVPISKDRVDSKQR